MYTIGTDTDRDLDDDWDNGDWKVDFDNMKLYYVEFARKNPEIPNEWDIDIVNDVIVYKDAVHGTWINLFNPSNPLYNPLYDAYRTWLLEKALRDSTDPTE